MGERYRVLIKGGWGCLVRGEMGCRVLSMGGGVVRRFRFL